MALKVNLKEVKKRIQEKKEQAQKSSKVAPEDNFILKVPEPGKYQFRALPYVHNENPAGNPFFEASYIYGVPVRGKRIFYSVKENDGVDHDPLTDFIWSQLKSVKGKKDEKGNPKAYQWSKFLPKMTIFVPGVLRGFEEKGVKFLKISTQKDKQSEKHQSLWEFFIDEDTEDWMDPDKGFDIDLYFEDNAQFGICPKQGPLVLARRPSKLKDYDSYLKSMPNILEDEEINGLRNGYIRRTLDETKELLQEWMGTVTPAVKEAVHNKDNETEMALSADDDVEEDDDFLDKSSDSGPDMEALNKKLESIDI